MVVAQTTMSEFRSPPAHLFLSKPGIRCKCSDGESRWLTAFSYRGLDAELITVPKLPEGVKVEKIWIDGKEYDYEKGDAE